MKIRMLILAVLAALAVPADEQAYWARQAQNPLADVLKYPVQTQLDFRYGHKDSANFAAVLQPSMSSGLSEKWRLVSRLDLPLHYQPGRTAGEKDSFGLGDTTYEGLITPVSSGPLALGFGPVLQLPSATDPQLGTQQWSAGPAAAAHYAAGPFSGGVRINHLWSFAGKNDRAGVNRTEIEYWLYANLGSGWWIGTSPVNSADWDAASDARWTVPVGGGFGKVVGRRIPLNLKFEAYSYAEVPNDLADWTFLFTLEYLLPENALFKH